jgi:FAD/FMN-containing dehydrogenase
MPIPSAYFDQVTYKCPSLEAVLDRLDETAKVTYSVAWIDCVATGQHLGRSVLTVGEHAKEGGLRAHGAPKLTLPFELPFPAVTPFTIKAFNALVYAKELKAVQRKRIHYAPFFYPLDVATHWNRLYGRDGFTQYQFVLPTAAGRQGLRTVLMRIAASGMGSPLAVLKVAGHANANPLSFPLAGYTLALDFKIQPGLFALLDELDALVLGLGGRLYLAKDARMSAATFKQSYPRWQEFQAVRAKVGAIGRFASLQSKRLGLD